MLISIRRLFPHGGLGVRARSFQSLRSVVRFPASYVRHARSPFSAGPPSFTLSLCAATGAGAALCRSMYSDMPWNIGLPRMALYAWSSTLLACVRQTLCLHDRLLRIPTHCTPKKRFWCTYLVSVIFFFSRPVRTPQVFFCLR